jgi:two-component sensor histidine kinase
MWEMRMRWLFPDVRSALEWIDVPLPGRLSRVDDKVAVQAERATLANIFLDLDSVAVAGVLGVCGSIAAAASAEAAAEVAIGTLAAVLAPAEVRMTTTAGRGPVEDGPTGPTPVPAPVLASVPFGRGWRDALVAPLSTGPSAAGGALLVARDTDAPALDGGEAALVVGVASALGNRLQAGLHAGLHAPRDLRIWGVLAPPPDPPGPAAVLAEEGGDAAEQPLLLAHELRRRLAALRVVGEAIDLTRSRGEDPGVLLDLLGAEVNELDRLGSELLEGSRPEDRHELVDLVQVVRSAVETIRRARGVEVRMAGSGHTIWLRTNRTLLRLAIENLLDNAVRYGAGSPVEIVVQLDGGARSAGAEVLVADGGPGLGAVRTRGAQLGLRLVQRLVEESGGRLWARSRSGGGTVLGLWLPLLGSPLVAGAMAAAMAADDDRRGGRRLRGSLAWGVRTHGGNDHDRAQ